MNKYDEYLEDLWTKTSNENRKMFLTCEDYTKFVGEYSQIARDMRNKFSMWDTPYTPEIINGVDHSPNHPDNLSMKILRNFWRQKQNQNV